MELQRTEYNPSFGYYHPIKKLWQNKQLKIEKGFYGGKITKKSFSFEHLKCHCNGGTTTLDNLVITTKENNNKRGNKPLKDFIDFKAMEEYLNQFKDITVEWFDGNKYIQAIRHTIKKLLQEEGVT
jgi:hypothetical protein